LRSEPPVATLDILASATTPRNRLERRPVSASSFSLRTVDRRCADGASGSLPDLCSRGVRPSRSLRDGAGGLLPGVLLGCLDMGEPGSRLRPRPSGEAIADQWGRGRVRGAYSITSRRNPTPATAACSGEERALIGTLGVAMVRRPISLQGPAGPNH
jgi:hypothetical protein